MHESESVTYDLAVIGVGMAGMAASLFGASRGLSIVQIGGTREIIFASGLFDLFGVHPVEKGHLWEDPWAAVDAVASDRPNHPYARMKKEDIRAAFDEILSAFQKTDLNYCRHQNRNAKLLTPIGTIKTTYAVPKSMWKGVNALKEKDSCLLIDIQGLKGFSGGLIKDVGKDRWPGLSHHRIVFPGTEHLSEVYAEHMANALVLSQNREKLARIVRPLVKDARSVGMPAILGLYRPDNVVADLERMIGLPVFEIPTMPPSVSGLRLKEAFERQLRSLGVTYFSRKKVLEARQGTGGDFEFGIGSTSIEQRVKSKGAILASGRFLGGGLHADRDRISETIFDLPVKQPETRARWHREHLLDPKGHPINRAGLEIDDQFRPIGKDGDFAFKRLFAAGSILADQDWKREKCGAGLAIATAFAAVSSFIKSCR
ncbi:MAG: glycerol-3-phosphate dehydrogenase subunit GlpB [Desulfobacterales bacterium]